MHSFSFLMNLTPFLDQVVTPVPEQTTGDAAGVLLIILIIFLVFVGFLIWDVLKKKRGDNK